jgi:hypothetical protein
MTNSTPGVSRALIWEGGWMSCDRFCPNTPYMSGLMIRGAGCQRGDGGGTGKERTQQQARRVGSVSLKYLPDLPT